MHYDSEIEINLPLQRVIELFDDSDNLKHWQDGLESFTHTSGEPGAPGATSDIVFQMGKRRINMVETIESRNLPEDFTAIYTTDGVWNRNSHQFTQVAPGITKWHQANEFRCSGVMMKLMTWLMPGMFKKQTMKYMKAFKEFAENRG